MSVPYYVGFPRSGSHWIRLNLEGYTNGNSPISSFLAAENESVHQLYARADKGEFRGTHDMDLNFEHKDVIYLFRNPVDTIYSQLVYEGENICKESIDKYLSIWISHINKWCFDETFTNKKTIICYEKLNKSFVEEFSKIVKHLGLEVDEDKIRETYKRYSKEKILGIIHDKKVINTKISYGARRNEFQKSFSRYIMSKVPEKQKKLWNDI